MASPKITRKGLSVETKMEIIRAVDSGRKKADVGRQYGIVSSTLSTILKNKTDIVSKFELSKFQPTRKRFRTATCEDVEEALLRWFRGARDKNLPVNGPLLRGKAEQLAKIYDMVSDMIEHLSKKQYSQLSQKKITDFFWVDKPKPNGSFQSHHKF